MAFWQSLLPMAATIGGGAIGSMFGMPQVGAAAGGALGGAIAGNEKYKQQKNIEDQTRNQLANEQRYSWATGQTPRTQIDFAGDQTNEMMAGALGGGMTGYSMGGGLGDLFGGKPKSMYAPTEYSPEVIKKGAGSMYSRMLANTGE